MQLADKLKLLRQQHGHVRGYGRAMTQAEVIAAMHEELGQGISQSYLSQLETGKRPHLSMPTRMLLARFYSVHPGYLVDEPPSDASHRSASPDGDGMVFQHLHHVVQRLLAHPARGHILQTLVQLVDMSEQELSDLVQHLHQRTSSLALTVE